MQAIIVTAPRFSFLNKSPEVIEEEFEKIPNEQLDNKPDPKFHPEFSVAVDLKNYYKNRWGNILPYDDNRVKLEGKEVDDYINASPCLRGRVIISQGPLEDGQGGISYPHHHADFYHMLWTNNCSAIAMVTDYEERGSVKCSRYLPKDSETPKIAGKYKVSICPDTDERNNYLRKLGIDITKVMITLKDVTNTVIHYHYPHWGDGNGAEGEVVAALAKRLLEEHNPLIHCSAGIGRSGTVAATMDAYDRTKNGQVPDSLIFDVVASLRSERRGCVQSPEQYQTIYDAVSILAKEDTSMQTQAN